MRFYIFLLVMVSGISFANAQIAGTVIDGKNSSLLVGVNIYLQTDSTGISVTNGAGQFEIAGMESLQIYNVKTNEVGAYYFTEGSENSGLLYVGGKLYIVGGLQEDLDDTTIEPTSVFSVDVSRISVE